MSTRQEYVLPSSESFLCQDRFDVLESDEEQVSFWNLLTRLLRQPVQATSQLVDVLETISLTLREKGIKDYDFLKEFLDGKDLLARVWPTITAVALEMPSLFPSARLPVLSHGQELHLSRRQVACLVVHQFLATLKAPPWQDGFQSFEIWYPSEQPHPKAVRAYLTALFAYFERLHAGSLEDWTVRFSINSEVNVRDGPLSLETVRLPQASTAPDLLGLPDGACVISANKFVGFGRTGTQEEVNVGASPESCPAVLVTPPLRDDQVLVVEGAEAMITISGYGRDAECSEMLTSGQAWARRTMLFMDALELDVSGSDFPDLLPGNIEREICKATLAFSSRASSAYSHIFTGYWGCRAFGGNVAIKAPIQLVAASRAGTRLKFVCTGEEQHRFADLLDSFVKSLQDRGCSSTNLELALKSLEPTSKEPEDIIEQVLARVEQYQ